MYIMKLIPAGKDYLWGGNKLKEKYGKKLDLEPLAETWEFSSHPDGLSVIENGELKNKTLLEVFDLYPELFGKNASKEKFIPILVKLIDAKNRLSVQVHPNDDYALKFENQNGKNEMWYILEATEGAKLVYGFEYDMTPELIKKSIQDGTIEKHLHFEQVKKGDVFFIPAGTVHGIGEGIVLAEIQENSNVTYRLYDYDRVDRDGNKRKLHIDKAIDVLNLKAFNGKVCQSKLIEFTPNCSVEQLCTFSKFSVQKYSLKGRLDYSAYKDAFSVLLIIDGHGIFSFNNEKLEIQKGDCFFIPAGIKDFQIYGDLELIRVNC